MPWECEEVSSEDRLSSENGKILGLGACSLDAGLAEGIPPFDPSDRRTPQFRSVFNRITMSADKYRLQAYMTKKKKKKKGSNVYKKVD